MINTLKQHRALALLLIILAIAFTLINFTHQTTADVIYWNYARHFHFAYLDSPYMFPLLSKSYMSIFGYSLMSYLYLKFFMLAVIVTCVYFCAYLLGNTRTGFFAALIFICIPSHFFIDASYHGSVIFFIALSLLCLILWHKKQKNIYLYLLGLCLGGVIMSQFEGFLFCFSLLIASFIVPCYKKMWSEKHTYFALIFTLLITIPFVYREIQLHWLTIHYLFSSHKEAQSLKTLAKALLENIGFINVFAVLFIATLIKLRGKQAWHSPEALFLWLFIGYSVLLNVFFPSVRVRHQDYTGANVPLAIFLGYYATNLCPKLTKVLVVLAAILFIPYETINVYFIKQPTQLVYQSILPKIATLTNKDTIIITHLPDYDISPSWFSIRLTHQPEVYALQDPHLNLNRVGNPAVYRIWQTKLKTLLQHHPHQPVLFLNQAKALPQQLKAQLDCKHLTPLNASVQEGGSLNLFLLHGTHKVSMVVYAHQCKLKTISI